MDDKWRLPHSIELGGVEYEIRTDFRVVLDIMQAMVDPELSQDEKIEILFRILFWNPEEIPEKYLQEAIDKAMVFLDCGISGEGKSKTRLMDWEQDSPLIASAINKNTGKDIRSLKYMHWWTFLGAYLEISEGVFHEILQIRQKKAAGKKLEKWEQEFYQKNKKLVNLKKETPKRSAEEEAALKELFSNYRKR